MTWICVSFCLHKMTVKEKVNSTEKSKFNWKKSDMIKNEK